MSGGVNNNHTGTDRTPGTRSPWNYALALGRQSYRYLEPNLVAVCLFAAAAFVLYYFVWVFLFPQTYENLTIRLVGAALCLVLAAKRYWPEPLRRYERAFFLFVCVYTLFFFTYMLLMNGMSVIWLLSTVAAIFFIVLLLDWLHLLLVSAAGTLSGWLVFVLTPDTPAVASVYFEYFPIFAFLVLGGMIFNYKAGLIRAERSRTVTSVAKAMSKELRPPIQLIKTGAASLQNFLPVLIRGYELATQRGLPVQPIDANHLRALESVPEHLAMEVENALAVVEMLIMNSAEDPLASQTFRRCRISTCIEDALNRYPFRSERDRSRITWRRDDDFEFFGSPKLTTHVMLNLLRLCLHDVALKGLGKVYIEVSKDEKRGYVTVRDTGFGAAPRVLDGLFGQDLTDDEIDRHGIAGLAFCKAVIEGHDGTMAAVSEHGGFTEFRITLPLVAPHATTRREAHSELGRPGPAPGSTAGPAAGIVPDIAD